MEPIEVPEQTGINDLAPRYPLSRLRTVTLPIHEVLETPPTTSGVHDTANGVDRTPVDHPRGGGREGGGNRGLRRTGFKQETWKAGWTLRVLGNFRRTTAGLMIRSTTNGPVNLEDNFFDSVHRGRFRVANQTLSPTT